MRIKNLSCPLGLQSQPITHFMTNIINGERERTGTFRHFFYTFKHTFQTKAEVIPSRNASGRRWRRFVVEHPLKSLARRIWPNFPGLFTKRIGNIVVFPALCKPRYAGISQNSSKTPLPQKGVRVVLGSILASIRGNLEQFAIFQINEVYIGREIQLYYLFA